MPLPSAPSTLASLLRRHGAPQSYIDRILDELASHRQDIIDELLHRGIALKDAEEQADRQLGDPRDIATAAVNAMRRASFFARHRVLWLIVFPLLLLPLSWIAIVLFAAWATGMLDPGFRAFLSVRQSSCFGIACDIADGFTPTLIAAVLYLLARRKFCGRLWACAPALLLALMSSVFGVRFFPTINSPHGRLLFMLDPAIDLFKLLWPISIILLGELANRVACNRIQGQKSLSQLT